MVVGTRHQPKGEALTVQDLLKLFGCLTNLRPGVVVETGKDVRRAGDRDDAVVDEGPCHGNRHRSVGGAVIDPCEDVAVQVDHVTLGASSWRHSPTMWN